MRYLCDFIEGFVCKEFHKNVIKNFEILHRCRLYVLHTITLSRLLSFSNSKYYDYLKLNSVYSNNEYLL